MRTGHTPGPWNWFDYPDGRKMLCARNGAVIHCPDAPMTCEPADERLIAAAPELLAALDALVKAVEREDNPRDEGLGSEADEMTVARAAIQSATGA